jgi:hypothetical protein
MTTDEHSCAIKKKDADFNKWQMHRGFWVLDGQTFMIYDNMIWYKYLGIVNKTFYLLFRREKDFVEFRC